MSFDGPFVLNERDTRIKNHATLCSIGFIIVLPFGALIGRYLRTFTKHWFWAHFAIQFLVAGPIIGVGWSLGYKSVAEAFTGHYMDRHERIGLCLLCLYCIQLLFGLLIHYFKLPTSVMGGHRPPQNYVHAMLGLAIVGLAFYQVHYGLVTEWFVGTLDGTVVPHSAMNAWLALVVLFPVLYALGLALLPRQYKQESAARAQVRAGEKGAAYQTTGSGSGSVA